MKISKALLLVILMIAAILASPPSAKAQSDFLFDRTWGGSGDDVANAVTTNSSGSIFIVGSTHSFGTGTPGATNVFVLNYNVAGDLGFQKTWGGSNGSDVASGVATDVAGNVYVTGYTESFGAGLTDVILLKFSSTGALLWQKTWGGSGSDEGHGVAIDSSSNIYVTGVTNSTGAGGNDFFLLKFNSAGSLQWQRTWGGANSDAGYGVAVNSSSIYLVGSTLSFGAASLDVALVKFDSAGNLQWQEKWGGSSSDDARAITLDPSGNIYVSGSTHSFGAGGLDALLLKVASNGTVLWSKAWGGSNADMGEGIASAPSGNVYVAGTTQSYGAGNDDAFILETDPSGAPILAETWGGSDQDQAHSVAVDPLGHSITAGTVGESEPYYFGSGNFTLGTSSQSEGSTAGSASTPSFSLGTPLGSIETPAGSNVFAGGRDAFLLKIGAIHFVDLSCGLGHICHIESNTDLSDTGSNSTAIHFTATGPTGASGYANVTIPKSAITNIDQLQVFLNGARLSSLDVGIKSNSTHYFVHFVYTFHSGVSVDLVFTVIAGGIPPDFSLILPILAAPILILQRARKKILRKTTSSSLKSSAQVWPESFPHPLHLMTTASASRGAGVPLLDYN